MTKKSKIGILACLTMVIPQYKFVSHTHTHANTHTHTHILTRNKDKNV